MRLTLFLGAAAAGGALVLGPCVAPHARAAAVALARVPVAAMNGLSPELNTQIEGMLEERDELRRGRDYSGADAIRDDLRAQFNVIIDDREKSWWVDDGSNRASSGGGGGGGGGGRNRGYELSGTAGSADVGAVEDLLNQREDLRRGRDFNGADAIRDELRFDFNVIVDDREKTWWVDDGSSAGARGGERGGDRRPAPGRGYSGSGGGSEANSAAIEELLEKRDSLRRDRDFNGAFGHSSYQCLAQPAREDSLCRGCGVIDVWWPIPEPVGSPNHTSFAATASFNGQLPAWLHTTQPPHRVVTDPCVPAAGTATPV